MTPSTTRLLVPLTLAALVATGCRSDGDGDGDTPSGSPRTLVVVSSDWNGWDAEHVATPETTTLPVRVGASAQVESTGETVTFEVVGVDGGRVEVSSDHKLAPQGETGGSNLNDLVHQVTVVPGDETVLRTPTLDAGYSYTLRLE